MDITNQNLEAAMLDQKVAGLFSGKRYAFVAVAVGRGSGKGYQLGVAVANEHGFSPIGGKSFSRYSEAKEWAEGLNRHIGLSKDDEFDIVISSMRRYKARAR